MKAFDKNSCKRDAEVFKALGHPIRLWIVRQLADGQEHCVCEFVDAVGLRFPTVSKHLSILKQAGVLADDKRGKSVFYRLRFPCLANVLSCFVGDGS